MNRKPAAVAGSPVSIALSSGVVIATLYFAQEVLIPLALSVLLAFLLAPMATRLQRRRFGKVPSVILVVTFAFSIILGLGWVVGKQLFVLAEDLPRYQDEIVHKVSMLRTSSGGFGKGLEQLGHEIERATVEPASQPASQPATTAASAPAQPAVVPPPPLPGRAIETNPVRGIARSAVNAPPTTAPATAGATPANPIYTVPLPTPVSPIQTLLTYLNIILSPLGTAGLVVIFTIFMLLDRNDLRDRLIRLVSRGKYTLTTRALDDAASRISRYVVAQTIVNGSYGITIGIGLWVIGHMLGNGIPFPSVAVWALLCASLRFIPYIGAWIASAFPVVLSLAVYPGFSVFLAVLALFVVIELLSNNIMEPLLYGSSTGLSTVAILAAAVFWTWLWGPVGLLMSTPLTVCFAVLGKHVKQLEFLDILLGATPALPPAVSYYQRLLSGDDIGAGEVAATALRNHDAAYLVDEVFVPTLLLTRRDRRDDDLPPEIEVRIATATERIAHDLLRPKKPAETKATEPKSGDDGKAEPQPARAPIPPLIIGCPAHHRAEEVVLSVLADMMIERCRLEITSTRSLQVEIEARVQRDNPLMVFIAIVAPGGIAEAASLCRRLRRRFPDMRIIVGYFGRVRDVDRLVIRLRSAGATDVVSSMAAAIKQIETVLPVPEIAEAISDKPSSTHAPVAAAPN